MREIPGFIVIMIAVASGGCGRSAARAKTPEPTSSRAEPTAARPALGAKCALPGASKAPEPPAAGTAPSTWAAPKVFLEVASLEGDLGALVTVTSSRPAPPSAPPSSGPKGWPREFSDVLNDPRLRVSRVGNLMAEDGVPAKLAWDSPRSDASGPCPQVERRDLTLTARASERGEIALEIDLAPAPPLGTPENAWSVPEHRRSHTTVRVGDQQSIVLGGFGEQGAGKTRSLLVVTPYVMQGDADVRALFECKIQARRATAK